MHLFVAFLALTAPPPEPADTLVVCPQPLASALEPWLAYRRAEGHRLATVSERLSAAGIRERIRLAARSGALKYVLLVGDADPADDRPSAARDRTTPAARVPAKVNLLWGSEPEIATDNWYADLDDDQVPDVAIGRLTPDGPEELSRMVRKILRYERTADHGPWQRQINLVAGSGGFGPLIDRILEIATRKLLTDEIPACYHTTMTYASWQSSFCPDPRAFHDMTLRRLNEGCLFWVYIGHGRPRYLAPMQVPGGALPILGADDARSLASAHGAPIALMLACYTGAFDLPEDCLAEEMLRAENGPVAVVAGSRVTMPYGMAVLGLAMMRELFDRKRPTLGDVLLHAKRRTALDDASDTDRQILDAIAGAISPAGDRLPEERIEHLALLNLLGDPLLRIPRPAGIELAGDATVVAGQRLLLTGRSPIAGRGMIELVCRRDRTKSALPPREQFVPNETFLRSFQTTYRQANDRCWYQQPLAVPRGAFQVELSVPASARGPCWARVFVTGTERAAMGATGLFVRRPKPENVAARDDRRSR